MEVDQSQLSSPSGSIITTNVSLFSTPYRHLTWSRPKATTSHPDALTQRTIALIEDQQNRLTEFLSYQATNWLAGQAMALVERTTTWGEQKPESQMTRDELITLVILDRMSGGQIFQDFDTDDARRELPEFGLAMDCAIDSGVAAHVGQLMP
jgi:hypothetical protein